MSRTLGTVARGVRTPIFREGDNVVEGVVSSVLTALKENGIQPHDKDVAAVTESVVARCQGNYATVEQIAADKSTGDELLDIFMVAKYLERIGDHATNLAEWVEYAQTGARSKNGHWVSPEAQATGWI